MASRLASKNIVIVGYSMGGLIARVLATDMGGRVGGAGCRGPLGGVKVQPGGREKLRQWIFWKPVPGVREVIFLATPHRGTRMADASFAQLGRRLVGLPASLVRFQARAFSALADALENECEQAFVTGSILSPGRQSGPSSALIAPGLTYHSVIGDRGRGGSPKLGRHCQLLELTPGRCRI
jgi:pimeloyl-ACP methyl ester carboxylesterase